jgi:hypothetical protein
MGINPLKPKVLTQVKFQSRITAEMLSRAFKRGRMARALVESFERAERQMYRCRSNIGEIDEATNKHQFFF